MPFYKFLDTKTGKEFEELMGITEKETYLKDNPHIQQLVNGFPGIGYNVITTKPADGFRDVLREIKQRNSRGFSKSTINTF